MDHDLFSLGDLVLQSGAVLPDAMLAYKTHGRLNATGDNVILCPTWFGGDHTGNEWLIGAGKALDPAQYLIVIPNLFGNGLSSSPSNTRPPFNAAAFPNITILDNVRAQHRLLVDHLGVRRVRLATGWSMGAMQVFHWGARYPEMVDLIAPFCGAARCSRHNFVFLEGLKAALHADSAFQGGWYSTPPTKGLRAFARVYAGWGFSQAFYRESLDAAALGFASIEDFLTGYWEPFFRDKDANDLLAMLWTWQHGNIAANDTYAGDFGAALAAITAKALIMPSATDLYFPPEDNVIEASKMPDARCVPIPSVWGHSAGGPYLNAEDFGFLDRHLRELLATVP